MPGPSSDRSDCSLSFLFRPRSVAVVGASRKPGSVGAAVLQNLIHCGFSGPVYPVNPHAASINSVRAYPSVGAIPDQVDLAVIVVPAAEVAAALEECGQKGVRVVLVISAGFGEKSDAGRAIEQALAKRAAFYGMRLVGPNCMGVLSAHPEVRLNATLAPAWPPPGPVGFFSQSGALGMVVLDYARQIGIGISEFVSTGNGADVRGNDILRHWEADDSTRVILLYLESFGQPQRFLELVRRISRRKPIVVVKSGRTVGGARATLSLTGAIAGEDIAVNALCRQTGAIRSDTIEELFDTALLLANQPVPAGNRVAVLTNSGGPGILAVDACESHGLELATPEPGTAAALRAFLPPEASVANPVDMLATATPKMYGQALPLLLADPGVDAVIVLFVPPVTADPTAVGEEIARAAHGSRKPVLTCLLGTHGISEGMRSLHQGNVPSYRFPEGAAKALSRAAAYGHWLRQPPGATPELTGLDLEGARRVIAGGLTAEGGTVVADVAEVVEVGGELSDDAGLRWLVPGEAHALLSAYGIRFAQPIFARNEFETVAAARQLGFPVAVKLATRTLRHKSDVGGVRLGLGDEREVLEAYDSIRLTLQERGMATEMVGMLVQPMAGEGVEVVVGMLRLPLFGPLLLFGLGGVQGEVLKDFAVRVHPLRDVDAQAMVREIRGFPLLDGYRGAPPCDMPAIEDLLLRLSRLAGDLPEVQQVDLHPVRLCAPGKGCIAVDARIGVRP